jgi:hypothetical protein
MRFVAGLQGWAALIDGRPIDEGRQDILSPFDFERPNVCLAPKAVVQDRLSVV